MKELKAIEIEINSHCNRACSYCPNIDQNRIEQGIMSHEIFKLIIHQLQEINYTGRISFSFYNEPMLSNDLEYFTSQTKLYLPKVEIVLYTNGTLLTATKFYRLIHAGIDLFIVTKHEIERDYVFDQTILLLSADHIKKYIKYQSYQELKLTNRGGLLIDIVKDKDTQNLPCVIPLHMMTITNKGTVVPCFEDYHQIHSMGSIQNKTLKEIWNSDSYINFRKKLLLGIRKDYSVCAKCNRTEILGIF